MSTICRPRPWGSSGAGRLPVDGVHSIGHCRQAELALETDASTVGASRPESRGLSASRPNLGILVIGAVLTLGAFVAFTAWRLAGGTAWLDAGGPLLTGFFLHGLVDIIVSSLWPLGEPQLGAVVIAVLAGVLILKKLWRLATVAVGCYTILTLLELGLRVGAGLASHSVHEALIHGYPSGHTARVPFLGGVLAALVPPRLRWVTIAGTGVLATGVAMDRVDSTLQTTSDVVGGLLIGTSLGLAFAAIRYVVERGDRSRRQGATANAYDQ